MKIVEKNHLYVPADRKTLQEAAKHRAEVEKLNERPLTQLAEKLLAAFES